MLVATAGYCEKMSGKKKKYETRYVRLTSCGVVTWYVNDADASSSRGAVQLRGVTSAHDHLDAKAVVSRVGKRDYRFRFADAEEAAAWLRAFLFYTPLPPLKGAKIRNSAK